MLMLIDGNTTAQTVKTYLQERGYRAGQSEVSCWLLRIAHREGWTINTTDNQRIYQFPVFMNTPARVFVTDPTSDVPVGIWRHAN